MRPLTSFCYWWGFKMAMISHTDDSYWDKTAICRMDLNDKIWNIIFKFVRTQIYQIYTNIPYLRYTVPLLQSMNMHQAVTIFIHKDKGFLCSLIMLSDHVKMKIRAAIFIATHKKWTTPISCHFLSSVICPVQKRILDLLLSKNTRVLVPGLLT